jgi:hypothetical protein
LNSFDAVITISFWQSSWGAPVQARCASITHALESHALCHRIGNRQNSDLFAVSPAAFG